MIYKVKNLKKIINKSICSNLFIILTAAATPPKPKNGAKSGQAGLIAPIVGASLIVEEIKKKNII